jgi:hypothetical protein
MNSNKAAFERKKQFTEFKWSITNQCKAENEQLKQAIQGQGIANQRRELQKVLWKCGCLNRVGINYGWAMWLLVTQHYDTWAIGYRY